MFLQFLVNKEGVPVKRYSPTTAPLVSVIPDISNTLKGSVRNDPVNPEIHSYNTLLQTILTRGDGRIQVDPCKENSNAHFLYLLCDKLPPLTYSNYFAKNN